jgi:hypothetical protein
MPPKKSDLEKLIERVYQTKLKEAGIKTLYEELEGTTFECEKLSLVGTQKLSLDQLFELYYDYFSLYQITEETKFLARAQFYKVQLEKRRMRLI